MATAAGLSLLASPSTAAATSCPGRPDALGTARTLVVSAATTPRVGRKQFPDTLPLADKELVLTFDDGPWPTTTPKVLDALKAECVRATFFLVGRNTDAHPQIVRREYAEGHSIGHHTYSHPLLPHMSLAKAEAEIDRGIARDELALNGVARKVPSTPFFRFPGFLSSQPLLDRLQDRGIVVFGADVWASDWNPMTPDAELQLLLERIDRVGRGIVLLHDTKAQTARMLPKLLRELKARGYSIVHVVPPALAVTN
ncbi:MAG: polysaccharide deacetylase family protein [Proteobacteria bacterium]|nr:polysaccharide deacetylase family protein [Pseudomonadota bacterium]